MCLIAWAKNSNRHVRTDVAGSGTAFAVCALAFRVFASLCALRIDFCAFSNYSEATLASKETRNMHSKHILLTNHQEAHIYMTQDCSCDADTYAESSSAQKRACRLGMLQATMGHVSRNEAEATCGVCYRVKSRLLKQMHMLL